MREVSTAHRTAPSSAQADSAQPTAQLHLLERPHRALCHNPCQRETRMVSARRRGGGARGSVQGHGQARRGAGESGADLAPSARPRQTTPGRARRSFRTGPRTANACSAKRTRPLRRSGARSPRESPCAAPARRPTRKLSPAHRCAPARHACLPCACTWPRL
eukprot:1570254-Rhodomonas_salina.1